MTKTKTLTKDEVMHIAKLANLQLSEKEIEVFTPQLTAVIAYINKLSEMDTTSVEPTSQVTGLTNIFRPDEIKQSLSSAEATSGKPSATDLFNVKAIFHEQD